MYENYIDIRQSKYKQKFNRYSVFVSLQVYRYTHKHWSIHSLRLFLGWQTVRSSTTRWHSIDSLFPWNNFLISYTLPDHEWKERGVFINLYSNHHDRYFQLVISEMGLIISWFRLTIQLTDAACFSFFNILFTCDA